ncbi:MAG: hypothetical protein SP1CHLAM54_09300 [Chlamydiia bacterium]|nr:hypothetical protein [Chlamydiia bacterium]MCH9615836.1 hypothetical protein [Chlamydiia bacterium]MCH9628761.1 hypothetical protein [Chlamydiia bacterium]
MKTTNRLVKYLKNGGELQVGLPIPQELHPTYANLVNTAYQVLKHTGYIPSAPPRVEVFPEDLLPLLDQVVADLGF